MHYRYRQCFMWHVARRLITLQGPLPNTTVDFWKMVLQQKTEVIVMTTGITEKGRKKCEKYWPDQEMSQRHGPVTVHCTSQTYALTNTVSLYVSIMIAYVHNLFILN